GGTRVGTGHSSPREHVYRGFGTVAELDGEDDVSSPDVLNSEGNLALVLCIGQRQVVPTSVDRPYPGDLGGATVPSPRCHVASNKGLSGPPGRPKGEPFPFWCPRHGSLPVSDCHQSPDLTVGNGVRPGSWLVSPSSEDKEEGNPHHDGEYANRDQPCRLLDG